MHKLARLFAMQWSRLLQYRFDVVLWMTVEAMTPLISLAVWYTVARAGGGVLSEQETITYYLLVIFVFIITNSWNGFFFAREILTGDLVKYLVRPLSVFWNHVSENITEKAIKLIIPVPLFLAVLVLLPQLWVPEIYEWSHIFIFIPSLLLAAALSFLFDMAIGAMAFWLDDADQLRHYKILLHEFTSGVLIPLALLPPLLQSTARWLPFRYIVSAPVEILMGQATGAAAGQLLVIQVLWAVLFGGLLAWLWRRGLQRYAVPGH